MHTNRAIFSNIRVIFVYFQKRQGKPSTLLLSSCALKLICFLERGWHSANVSFRTMSKFSKISLLTLKCPALHGLCFFFSCVGTKAPPAAKMPWGYLSVKVSMIQCKNSCLKYIQIKDGLYSKYKSIKLSIYGPKII